ncbi:MAG: hypothetical protein QXT45_05165 [Candidatus Bilamarchaeaceae archaeon]
MTKRFLVAIIFFLALLPLSVQQGGLSKEFEERTSIFPMELVSSWHALSALAIFTSIVLVAIAYAISIGLELPELKGWARTELVQVFSTAIIILALMGVIAFLDGLTAAMITESGVMACGVGQNCLQQVAVKYINSSIDGAEAGAYDTLQNSMKAGAWTGRGIGIYATSIILAQLGISTTLGAHYMLDVDRYAIVYEYYTNILSALYAQKFFLEQYAFKVGPIVLALGIVARSFFLTRKTGGLLIAIAAGVMFFLPMMYVFDWMTLDMMISGDNSAMGDPSLCPPECMAATPIAYYSEGVVKDESELYAMFPEELRDEAFGLVEGSIQSLSNGTETFYSCNYDENPDDGVGCPPVCRELPYPASVPACADLENRSACAALNDRCKSIRLIPNGTNSLINPEYAVCPAECKIVPPLKGNCSIGRCLESRFDCRVAKRTDLSWRPSVSKDISGHERCHEYASDCPASLDAYESCTWVIPETGSCDSLCAGCPVYCRISGAQFSNLPSDCFKSESSPPYDEGDLLDACARCHPTCMVDRNAIEAKGPQPPSSLCLNCPPEKRLLGGFLPPDYLSGECSLDACPAEYRVAIPRSACEQCLDVSESFLYDPPINTECGELCKPSTKIPTKSVSDFMKTGEEDLVGFSEIQNVSKYMVPAYLLPLFNITATLIFILSLSAILGGDIEIPGISKVF